jgi:AcrR family transcriptional regulator
MSEIVTSDILAKPNLKLRLIDVATALLVEHRKVSLPTMRQIAAAAGVTPGAAYRHFSSQEELFIAVVSHLFADLESTLTQAADSSTGLRDTVRRVSLSYVNWGLHNPGGYQLLFETTDDDELLKEGHRPGLHLLDHFAHLLVSGGQPKPKNAEKAIQAWVSLHGLVSLRIHKTGMPWTTTAEHDVDAILKAIFRPF